MNLPAGQCALSLRGLCIAYGERPVLNGVDLELPRRGVTVLLGPSGTGKSTLLRTVAGENVSHPSIRVEGAIHYMVPGERPPLIMQKARLLLASVFENLVHDWPERSSLTAVQQHAHVSQWLASLGLPQLAQRLQVPVVELPLPEQRLVPVLRRAMMPTPLLLVDEPTAGLSDTQAEPVLAVLRQLGRERSLFVAMHHLGHSRSIADAVVLLASRRLQEHSSAERFFSTPASESGRLFLRTGSCPEEPLHPVAAGPAPELMAVPPPAPAEQPRMPPLRPRTLGPTGFAWLLPGQLVGTPWPGLVQPPAYDLDLLKGVGITRLLSVTDRPFAAELAGQHGMAVENEPMVDMQPPGIEQAISLCRRIEATLARGEVIAVHCRAGLGRTGTTLAAYWLWLHAGSLSGEEALQQVRRFHPGWVQSDTQIDFLHAFAPAVARVKSSVPSPSAATATAATGLQSAP